MEGEDKEVHGRRGCDTGKTKVIQDTYWLCCFEQVT